MQKIRPYNSNIHIPIYDRMAEHYDIIVDGDINMRAPRLWFDNRVMFKDIVYYINILYENDPTLVADIGSGSNVWSKWFPNIMTFEPLPTEWGSADSEERFNYKFTKKYKKKFDCAMAINSLHYRSFDDIPDLLDMCMDIVNDSFLFTFNLKILYKYEIEHQGPHKESFLLKYNYEDGLEKINNILNSTPYTIKMFDHIGNNDDLCGINGHVRFILQNNEN
jgi:hypothetical protein